MSGWGQIWHSSWSSKFELYGSTVDISIFTHWHTVEAFRWFLEGKKGQCPGVFSLGHCLKCSFIFTPTSPHSQLPHIWQLLSESFAVTSYCFYPFSICVQLSDISSNNLNPPAALSHIAQGKSPPDSKQNANMSRVCVPVKAKDSSTFLNPTKQLLRLNPTKLRPLRKFNNMLYTLSVKLRQKKRVLKV